MIRSVNSIEYEFLFAEMAPQKIESVLSSIESFLRTSGRLRSQSVQPFFCKKRCAATLSATVNSFASSAISFEKFEIGKHIQLDCSVIYVRQQREKTINRVKAHLKTESGCREVDLHPDAAAILRTFLGDRKSGFLFQTVKGAMFDPRNIARDSLDPILEEMGRDREGTCFNVFRRFREAVLQRSDARSILIDYWMGHSNSRIGDRAWQTTGGGYGVPARTGHASRARFRSSTGLIWATWATNCGKLGSSIKLKMCNSKKIREEVVGAKGFEPSTSWSRTPRISRQNNLKS